MKKKYLLLLVLTSILFIPSIKADAIEDIFDDISETSELVVPSIPLSHYEYVCEESEFFDSCMNNVYGTIVMSYINKMSVISSDYTYYTSCDVSTNICTVHIGESERNYNVSLNGTYDEEVFEDAKTFANSIKNNYYLQDMDYINQIINFSTAESDGIHYRYGDQKVLKLFPELKEKLESNPNFQIIPVTMGFGSNPELFGGVGSMIVYYNNIAYAMKSEVGYNTVRVVFVEDDTNDIVERALERIKNYINDSDIEVTITSAIEEDDIICGEEHCNISDTINNILNTEEEYVVDNYVLTIDSHKYTLFIIKVEAEVIKETEIKSLSYATGIRMATTGNNVPLDTSLMVEELDLENNDILKAFDISLFSLLQNGYITKINNGVKVMIPMPSDFDKNNMTVYHIKEDGSKGETFEYTIEKINEKDFIVFTTNHFSIYALGAKQQNPKTGDEVLKSLIVFVISLTSLLIINSIRKERVN